MIRLFKLLVIASLLECSAGAQQSVATPVVSPPAVVVNTPTAVKLSALINPGTSQVVVGSVYVYQVINTGSIISLLGVLNDAGNSGDLFANDLIYGGTIILNEPQSGRVLLQVSAAFKGTLKRVTSPIVSLPVLGPGVPTSPIASDPNTVIADPQSGTPTVCNELLVKFAPAATPSQIISAVSQVQGSIIGTIPELNVYQVQLPSCSLTALHIAQQQLTPSVTVLYVDLDVVGTVAQTAQTANDPLLSTQWGIIATQQESD